MAKIAYQVSLAIPNGPKVGLAGDVEGDTYSKSEIEVPAQTPGPPATPGELTLTLDAGAAEKIVLLLISTDKNAYSDDLEFKLDSAATKTYTLSAPFLVLGAAAAQMLDTALGTLEFTNKTTQPVKIEILVGRNASA